MKLKIKAIINEKASTIYSVSPDNTVYDALKLMAEANIGALLVKVNDRVVGIISERDYARKIILQQKSSPETKVSEIMSSKILTISPEQTVDEAMLMMTNKNIRHLPVIDEDDRLVGIVSIGDLVKTVIESQKQVIKHLENYIKGN
ncbi:MAG: Inosine-5'-monophosphate dehydrogenase [Hyphomicrobiaceae bacterium hypho_1]